MKSKDSVGRELVFQVPNATCRYRGVGWESSRVGGEIVLRRTEDGTAGRLEVLRLGLVGASPSLRSPRAHKLALSAYSGSGELSVSENGLLAFDLALPAVLVCNTNPGCNGTGLKSRSLRGTFAGAFREISDGGVETLVLETGGLVLQADAGDAAEAAGAELFSLEVDLSDAPLRPLTVPPATRRDLKLQPVQHTTGGQNPTGTLWPAQLAVAQQVWGQCCILFNPQTMITVDNATAARSSNDYCTQLQAMTSAVAPDAIPVFYIDNPLSGDGGGWTEMAGSGADAVFISSQVHDSTVLAHELGHVLGGKHPGTVLATGGASWVGSPNTILVPGNPSPKHNSGHNCSCAHHCLLTTSSVACASTPDLA